MDMKLITPTKAEKLKKYVKLPWYGRKPHPETIERVSILLRMNLGQVVIVPIDEVTFWRNLLIRIRERHIKTFPQLYGKKFQTLKLMELNQLLIVRVE